MTELRRFGCEMCAYVTMLPDAPASFATAAGMGFGHAKTAKREYCCGASCRQQAERDAQNQVVSLTGDQVEAQLAARRAESAMTRGERAAASREVAVRVRCRSCGHSAELVGTLDVTGMVRPEPAETAAMLGWLRSPAGWCCSRGCEIQLGVDTAPKVTVAPVVKLSDATVRRRLSSDATTTAQRRLASTPEPGGKPPRSAA